MSLKRKSLFSERERRIWLWERKYFNPAWKSHNSGRQFKSDARTYPGKFTDWHSNCNKQIFYLAYWRWGLIVTTMNGTNRLHLCEPFHKCCLKGGSVQRKLRWGETSIYQWVWASDRGAGHCFIS
jgi:hypothetical protein